MVTLTLEPQCYEGSNAALGAAFSTERGNLLLDDRLDYGLALPRLPLLLGVPFVDCSPAGASVFAIVKMTLEAVERDLS